MEFFQIVLEAVMDTMKEYAEVLSGLLTPLIAFIAVYIAWQQHKTSRNTLRLKLYDRRLKVYRGLLDLFAAVLEDNNNMPPNLGKYYADTSEKKFLFDDKIVEFMHEVRNKAVKMRQVKRRLTTPPTPNEKKVNKLREQERELLAWFSDQLDQLPDKFAKSLGFTHVL